MSANETPARLGFIMPPAWGAHARSWMAWPCRTEIWREGIAPAKHAFAEIAKAIARFEPIVMAAPPADADQARALCGAAVEIWPVPLNDSWARDIAPVFVTRPGEVAGIDWAFNAWGQKYAPFDEDARFASRVLERQNLRAFAGGMVLEGGAIASDGAGTIMVSEECLLHPSRNPGMTRAAIEERLKSQLGAVRVLWLGQGLSGDETDGHIDNVACFTPSRAVLLALPDDARDPSAQAMRDNERRLRQAGLEVIAVPLPKPGPFTRSYINFAVTNGGLVIPAFGDRADDKAAQLIAMAFPGRTIMQIDANPIVAGGGGIHCITYEEPAAP